MENEKIIILPRLNDQNGDPLKKWFVFYSCRDPRTNEMKRKKVYRALHKYKTTTTRYKVTEKLIEEISQKLKSGFNPWIKATAIYTNSVEYEHAARVFGRHKAGNKTFAYYASRFIKDELTDLSKETIGTYTSRLRIF